MHVVWVTDSGVNQWFQSLFRCRIIATLNFSMEFNIINTINMINIKRVHFIATLITSTKGSLQYDWKMKKYTGLLKIIINDGLNNLFWECVDVYNFIVFLLHSKRYSSVPLSSPEQRTKLSRVARFSFKAFKDLMLSPASYIIRTNFLEAHHSHTNGGAILNSSPVWFEVESFCEERAHFLHHVHFHNG